MQELPAALKIALRKDEAVYRQITRHLRALILSQTLPPGMRLPTIKALAQAWDTNYFTVQNGLIPLINEGLLRSRQGCGTFVAVESKRLHSVGLYCGSDFWDPTRGPFFQTLYLALSRELFSRDITPHLFIDPRLPAEQNTPFRPLLRAMEERTIQGVITMALNHHRQKWVDTLPAPHSSLSPKGLPHCVAFDFRQMVELGLGRLAARGCHKAGLFYSSLIWGKQEPEFLQEAAQRHGLAISADWIYDADSKSANMEAVGFERFKKLWRKKARPDGLLVYPDDLGRGVLTAIQHEGVRVPEEIQLVLYYTEGLPVHSPLPVDWISQNPLWVARALIEQLQKQFDHKPVEATYVKMQMNPLI